jgi:hypothetical protein
MRVWWSTLKELRLIGGIGAGIAHSILCRFTKDAMKDQIPTFVTSAKQEKTKGVAQPRIAA